MRNDAHLRTVHLGRAFSHAASIASTMTENLRRRASATNPRPPPARRPRRRPPSRAPTTARAPPRRPRTRASRSKTPERGPRRASHRVPTSSRHPHPHHNHHHHRASSRAPPPSRRLLARAASSRARALPLARTRVPSRATRPGTWWRRASCDVDKKIKTPTHHNPRIYTTRRPSNTRHRRPR